MISKAAFCPVPLHAESPLLTTSWADEIEKNAFGISVVPEELIIAENLARRIGRRNGYIRLDLG